MVVKSKNVTVIEQLDENHIISGSIDKILRLWNLKTGQCIAALQGHQGNISALAVFPSGKVVSISNSLTCLPHEPDAHVRIWNPWQNQCLGILEGHSQKIEHLVKLNQRQVLTGSSDKTLRVWDIEAQQVVKVISLPILDTTCQLSAMMVLSSGLVLCSATYRMLPDSVSQNDLFLINPQQGIILRAFKGHLAKINQLLELSSQYVASCSHDHTFRIWDLQLGICVQLINCHEPVMSLAKLERGQIVAGTQNGEMQIVNFPFAKRLDLNPEPYALRFTY